MGVKSFVWIGSRAPNVILDLGRCVDSWVVRVEVSTEGSEDGEHDLARLSSAERRKAGSKKAHLSADEKCIHYFVRPLLLYVEEEFSGGAASEQTRVHVRVQRDMKNTSCKYNACSSYDALTLDHKYETTLSKRWG